jgi:hypothetical protein
VSLADVIEGWLGGWVISRGVPAPVRRPYGFVVDIGTPAERRRHLLTDPGDDTIAAVAATIAEPATWMKFPRRPAEVARLFGPAWQVHDQQHLMGLRLAPAPRRPPPPGYRVDVSPEPGAVQVRVHAADGAVAARGRVGLGERYAVMDQIETEVPHQRRGLGRVVMATLGDQALAQGLTAAALLASDQGRALYEALGWSLITPFTAVSYQAPVR